MDVWLLRRVAGARVEADVSEAVHDDAVDEVDGLPGAGQVHLGPVVLARGRVDVAGRRRRGHTRVAATGILYNICRIKGLDIRGKTAIPIQKTLQAQDISIETSKLTSISKCVMN